MGNKNWWVMAVITAVLVAACNTGTAGTPAPGTSAPGTSAAGTSAPGTDEPPASEAPEPSTPPVPALPETPTGYAELDAALTETTTNDAGETVPIYNGKTVSIQTQWIGGEGANFAAAIADFAKATGITIQIDSIGSSHETVLKTRIDGGTPPDLAMLAQPTAVLAYGAEGKLVDVADWGEQLVDQHSATIGLITDADGHIWGIPYKADVKSTVWYPLKSFEKAGYEVPTTWDDMIALSDQIVADGSKPWCAGMEAGTATGWQYTDWVEEIMLRTQTPETYNAWINHELPFNSPEVKAAFEMTDQILSEEYVFGGLQAVMNIPQTEAFDGAFPEDGSDNWDDWTPKCYMHKIPTWYGPDFFPDVRAGGPGTVTQYEIGEDIGIFYLPPINPEQGNAALGSADTLMVLQPAAADAEVRPEVKAVAQFLSTPEGTQRWIETGSAISANNTTPQEWYAGFYKLDVASKIVNDASYVGFDASDLMPPEVSSGTFWTEAVAHVNDGKPLDDVLAAIDATPIGEDNKFGNW